MLIYRCDRCGKEHKLPRISGNEWAYTKDAGENEFVSIYSTVPGVEDLCKSCFKGLRELERPTEEAAKAARNRARSEFLLNGNASPASQEARETGKFFWPMVKVTARELLSMFPRVRSR